MSSTTPSTYSKIFGENPHAEWFLTHLGIQRTDFGRFRDVAFYRDGVVKGKGIYVIRVLTRNAGSKTQYQATNEKLAAHALYIRQELEPTDEKGTYLYFFFAIPETMDTELRESGVDLDIAFSNGDHWLVDNRSLKTKYIEVGRGSE